MSKIKDKIPNKRDIRNAKSFTSKKLNLNIEKLEKGFYRSDIIFYGMQNNVPSYEGRVFINNPEANLETPLDLQHGFVGTYFIFGHGSCLGDTGHCSVHAKREKFDLIPNHIRPFDHSMNITTKLKELAKDAKEFSITVVPYVIPPPLIDHEEIDLENIVVYSRVEIVTYDLEES